MVLGFFMNRIAALNWFCASLTVFGCLFVGCTKQGTKTYPATVTVTYPDKKPVVGAQVVLHSGELKVSPRCSTGSDGSCKLTTFKQDDGAPPGHYQVIVARPPLMGDPDKPYKGPQIADKFANLATSGLEATVTEDATKNTFPLVVTAQ
jgi:hypothetical protein